MFLYLLIFKFSVGSTLTVEIPVLMKRRSIRNYLREGSWKAHMTFLMDWAGNFSPYWALPLDPLKRFWVVDLGIQLKPDPMPSCYAAHHDWPTNRFFIFNCVDFDSNSGPHDILNILLAGIMVIMPQHLFPQSYIFSVSIF